MDVWQFITDPSNDFIGHTLDYLKVSGFSILIATLIGVVLGVAVSRNAFLGFIAVNTSGLMRAIPVIAFLVAALPYLGVGFLPAVTALIVLGIPPILLNTYTSIRGLDQAMIDAAKGMGMTNWQIITRIQAPLVLPVVAAGVRTAAVQIVATTTLAAIINAGGYGEYILYGIDQFDNAAILAGAIPVAVLAMLIEICMGWLENRLTPTGLRVQEQSETAKA